MDDIIDMVAKIKREEENQRREQLNFVQRMMAMQNPRFAQMPSIASTTHSSVNPNPEVSSAFQKLGVQEGHVVAGKCFCPAKGNRPVGRPSGSYGYRTPPPINENKLINRIKKEVISDVKESEKKKSHDLQNSETKN